MFERILNVLTKNMGYSLLLVVSLLMFAVFSALLLLTGCASSKNLENSRKLRVGMTKAQVLEVMGRPLEDEIFCKPDVWFYQIETIWADGLTTMDECMPLVFENGKLSGWGNSFYTRYGTRGIRNVSEIKAPAPVK